MPSGRVQPSLGLSFPKVRYRDRLNALSGPCRPSFSESVTQTGAKRCISWASAFPLLSPVGKGAGPCFLRTDGSHHGGSFSGFYGDM